MAYEILSNPEKRRLYDQAGEQGIKEGGGGGGGFSSNPMDIFDMFFGGGDPFGRGGGRRGPRRTKNLVHQLSVSLEDMYNGTVRKLALQKNVICDSCDGVGGKAGAVQKCPNCRGTGMQVRIQQLGPGMMQQIQMCDDLKEEKVNLKSCKDCCKDAKDGSKIVAELIGELTGSVKNIKYVLMSVGSFSTLAS